MHLQPPWRKTASRRSGAGPARHPRWDRGAEATDRSDWGTCGCDRFLVRL